MEAVIWIRQITDDGGQVAVLIQWFQGVAGASWCAAPGGTRTLVGLAAVGPLVVVPVFRGWPLRRLAGHLWFWLDGPYAAFQFAGIQLCNSILYRFFVSTCNSLSSAIILKSIMYS